MDDRRLSPRTDNVVFVFHLPNGKQEAVRSKDASRRAACFHAAQARLLDHALTGTFSLNGDSLRIQRMQLRPIENRKDVCVLAYEVERFDSAPAQKQVGNYLVKELSVVWDRYVRLEDMNKVNESRILRLFILLLVFAAAPFSLQGFGTSGFIRVWGFGGVWLAVTVWAYFDRVFQAYAERIVERVFCLRQIHLIRLTSVPQTNPYWNSSLFPTERESEGEVVSGDPTHISTRQMAFSAYFYKLLSLFLPFYLILFIALMYDPLTMIHRDSNDALRMYAQVTFGLSGVFIIWILSSKNRCLALLKAVYRSRRISPATPWPFAPTNRKSKSLLPSEWQLVERVLLSCAIGVAVLNLFYVLLVELSSVLVKWPWRAHFGVVLLISTVFLYGLLFLYYELFLRKFIRTLSKRTPEPRPWHG